MLLDALRTWRTEKARAAGMPAYVICNDRTLVEIASVRPTTPDELLTVHGLGEVKVGRFGDELLALVGEPERRAVDGLPGREPLRRDHRRDHRRLRRPRPGRVARPARPLSAGELLEHRRDFDTVTSHVRYAYRGDLPPGASAVVDPARLSWVQVTELDLVQRRALVVLQPDHYPDRLAARAVERFERRRWAAPTAPSTAS